MWFAQLDFGKGNQRIYNAVIWNHHVVSKVAWWQNPYYGALHKYQAQIDYFVHPFWLGWGMIPYGGIYNKMSKSYYVFTYHVFLLYHLRKQILNYFSHKNLLQIHGPTPQSIFSKGKGAEKVGPYSGGKSSDFPTLFHFPNFWTTKKCRSKTLYLKKKVQLLYSGWRYKIC